MLQNRTLLIVGECLKNFCLIALPILPGDVTKDFKNYRKQLSQFLLKSNQILMQSGHCIALNGLMNVAKKKNTKKFG